MIIHVNILKLRTYVEGYYFTPYLRPFCKFLHVQTGAPTSSGAFWSLHDHSFMAVHDLLALEV